jgi:cellobiose-specific phosphotransferase system component IIA
MADNGILSEESILQLVNQLIGVEAAAREAADAQEAINRQDGDDSLAQIIQQESDDRHSAISSLQSSVNQSINRIDGNVTQLQLLFNQRHSASTELISNLNASFSEKVALLEGLRQTVLNNKDSIDILTGDESTVGSVAKALFDAKSYTDTKIAQVLNGAPAILDTLKELADAVGNDKDFFTNINTSIQEAKDSINSNKQNFLNLLSNDLIKNQKIEITSQHVAQGYIIIPHINIIHKSIGVHIGRLSLFLNEDFGLVEMETYTKLVFSNALAAGGLEAIEVGDVLRVSYWAI